MAFTNLEKDVEKRVSQWTPTDPSCPLPILSITRELRPDSLVGIAGLWNAIWASFERTLYDFYTNFGFKLATYASVNPRADLGDFYSTLITQTQFGILGLPTGDPSVAYILSEFSYENPARTDVVQIPFSPMLASSLTVSAFFWAYIGMIYISRLASTLHGAVAPVFERVDFNKAPFTIIGISIGIVLTGAYLFFFVVGALWKILF